MEKKNLAIIILAVVLAVSGIGNVILAVLGGFIEFAPSVEHTIVVGQGSRLAAIDPLDTWDVPSHVAEHQVVEGLVGYNYSDHPNYAIVPTLATSWRWLNSSAVEFVLRQGVLFHDDTLFNAEAAAWNLNRLIYFCNYTGTLVANDTSWEAFPAALYYFSNGDPMLKSVYVSAPYNITIELFGPFSALIDLLTFSATYMLSPASTPRYSFLDLTTGILVGTGPFKYISYTPLEEVRFERNDRYWGKKPWAKDLIFRIIEDDTVRMVAGISGQFDYVGGVTKDFIDIFKSDTEFHVEDVGQDLCYFYMEIYSGPPEGESPIVGGLVNQRWSVDFRRALLLSIDYDYIIDEIQSGYAYPGTPAVPRAMPGYNETVGGDRDTGLGGLMANHYPFGDHTWNSSIEKAREIMMGLYPVETAGLVASIDPENKTNDALWKALGLETLQLNQHFGSSTHQKLNVLFADNLAYIGLDSVVTVRTWTEYLETGENSPWEMDLGYIGWCPDYLDAFNMLDPLFNNKSGSCFSRISDPYLLSLLEEASTEPDKGVREGIYGEIQSLIFDITRAPNPAAACHGSGWVYFVQQTHDKDLKGVAYNVMTMLDCWNWKK